MNKASYVLSFSCERASAFIPDWIEDNFLEEDTLWQRAERHDPYAKELAEAWSGIAKSPLHLASISNQVCDMDRSERNPAIWSPWTAHVPLTAKHRLLEEWYRPYRENLTYALDRQLAKGHQVLHISIRSCLPKEASSLLNLQYATSHSEEKHVACAWQSVLRRSNPQICLRRNSPKYGHADSFATALRKHFGRNDFLSLGVNSSRDKTPVEQAQILHTALKKVLHGMWR